MMFQFIISEVIRRLSLPMLKYWYILSSTIFIVYKMGVRQIVVVLIQPILYGAVIYMGGNKQCIWFISLLLLGGYNSLKYKQFFWNYLEHEEIQDEEIYLILFSVAWIELRCISYCIDYIERRDKDEIYRISFWYDIINMLSYILYLPLLYTGPVILYAEFEKSLNIKGGPLWLRLKQFFCDMLVYKLYTFILDFALHYIYFFAMQDNMEVCFYNSIRYSNVK